MSLSALTRVLPGAAVLAADVIDPLDRDQSVAIEVHTTAEAQQLFGVQAKHDDD